MVCALRGDLQKVSHRSCVHLRNCPLTLNDDIPGLDGDLDPLGDVEQFLGVAVPIVSPCPSKSLIVLRCELSDFDRRCGACFVRVIRGKRRPAHGHRG